MKGSHLLHLQSVMKGRPIQYRPSWPPSFHDNHHDNHRDNHHDNHLDNHLYNNHDNHHGNHHGNHDHLGLTMVMKPTTRRPLSTIPGTTLLILSISINSEYFSCSLMHLLTEYLCVCLCIFTLVTFLRDSYIPTCTLQSGHSIGALETIWKLVRNTRRVPPAKQTGSPTIVFVVGILECWVGCLKSMASVNTFTFVWDRILKLIAFVKTFKVVGDQTLKLNALVTSSRTSF